MIKIVCLLALITFSYSQTVDGQSVSSLANAATSTSVGQALSAAEGSNLLSAVPSQSALSSVTVGSGSRNVLVTPQTPNATLNDWVNGQVNVAQQPGNETEGEWTLNWTVTNGDNYTLVNRSGDLVVVDLTSGAQQDLGQDAALNSEVANGADQLVNYVYNDEVTTVQGSQITNWLTGVLAGGSAAGFLANQDQSESVAQAAGTAVNNTGAIVGAVAGQLSQTGQTGQTNQTAQNNTAPTVDLTQNTNNNNPIDTTTLTSPSTTNPVSTTSGNNNIL